MHRWQDKSNIRKGTNTDQMHEDSRYRNKQTPVQKEEKRPEQGHMRLKSNETKMGRKRTKERTEETSELNLLEEVIDRISEVHAYEVMATRHFLLSQWCWVQEFQMVLV
jgi:hypothetical protein